MVGMRILRGMGGLNGYRGIGLKMGDRREGMRDPDQMFNGSLFNGGF